MLHGISKNTKPTQLKPTKESLRDLYYKKELSMAQVAKKLKKGKTSVKRYLQRYKIKIRSSKEGQKLRLKQNGKFGGYIKDRLTDKQKQFIIGTLLGDGTLYLDERGINVRLKIEHTNKDEKYVNFKHSIIKNFVTGKIIKNIIFNKKVKKYYSSLTFITTTHPEFTKFHKLFYQRKRKIVTSTILNQLTPLGLAIWIMDNG